MERSRSRTVTRPAPQRASAVAAPPVRTGRRGASLTPARNTAELTNIIRRAERPSVSAARAPASTPATERAPASTPVGERISSPLAPALSPAPRAAGAPTATPGPRTGAAPPTVSTALPSVAPDASPAGGPTSAPARGATAPATASSRGTPLAAPAAGGGGAATTTSSGEAAAPAAGGGARGARAAPPSAAAPETETPRRARGGGGGRAPGAAAAEGGEAGAGAAGAAGAGSGDVPLLMPEPPQGLSPRAQARVAGVQARAATTAATQADLPPAGAQVADAREAVTLPVEEREARAQSSLVETLGTQPEPSPEIERLCERIREVIRAKRPPDEDSLVQAQPEEMAREAGAEVGQGVQGEVASVEGSYQGLQQDPAAPPAAPAQELPPTPEAAAAPPISAASASPDAVPPEDVSLDADVEANRQRMADAGMENEPAQLVQNGPIAEARGAQDELEQTAAESPAEVLAQQEATLNQSRSDMAQLQEAALEALRSSRSRTTTGTRGQQERMVGSEEQLRTQASARAQEIFNEAQRRVQELLQPLTDTAMRRWEAGIQRLSSNFRADLRRVEALIEERHSGAGGAVLSVWDAVTGMPDWVTKDYDRAERAFGDGACELARDISRQVNGVIATCEAIIDQARADIANVFAQLPASLQEWAAGEQARLGESLDGLRDQARQQRDQFNQRLIQQASQAVQDVRQQIHGLRQKARGLLGRALDAINAFLEDPARFIIEGLLSLLGIAPSAFWAVVARIRAVISDIAADPLGFAGNLLRAVGEGFRLFFDNIGGHLLRGLLDWLFSGLAGAGVELPRDMSLGSIVTFFLQLMGITWERIRRLLARRIGERNVALIEQAWSIISTLVQRGPAGIFEMLKDRFNPQEILDQVLTAARDAIIEAVITRVTARILLMFNPVGAILQAIEAIYRVLKWIFDNAARIFSLVETVVNGIADILAGNTAGVARAVEQALGRLVAPVIDFLAGFLGLGNLPDRIRGVVERMQTWVEGILDRVIGWLATQAQRLLRAVGLGGAQEQQRPPAGAGAQGGDTELGETVRFSEGGEAHRMWVAVQGGRATLMVASTPSPVMELLERWSARVGELSDTPDEHGVRPRQRAHSLLTQAGALARAADEAADTLAQQWRTTPTPAASAAAGGPPPATGATGAAPANPDDSQLESQQQQLARVMQALFELFHPNASQSPPVTRFAPDLARADSDAAQLLQRALTTNAPTYQPFTGWAQAQSAFETDPITQGMMSGPLNQDHGFGRKVHTRAIPQVQHALADAGAPPAERTPAKAESLLVNHKANVHSGTHPSFPNTKRALRAEIFASNRAPVTDSHIYRDYKTRLESDVEGLHDKYKPQVISETKDANGEVLTIVYKGAGNAQFTVNRAEGLIRRIEGTGLRHKRDLGITNRGYTGQASAYVPDRSMVSAHLIADQFTGSGYKNALNLVTTSAHFNDPVMKGIETLIRSTWETYLRSLEALTLDTTTVTFDLTVNVFWMDVMVPQLIPRIIREVGDRLLAHYPHWDKDNLKNEIEAKLTTGLIGASPDLKRVANVKYTLTLNGPHAPGPFRWFSGPDLWLGFHNIRFT